MSMKNSSDTIGNRTRDLPACSTVPQQTAPPRASFKLLTSVTNLNDLANWIIIWTHRAMFCFVEFLSTVEWRLLKGSLFSLSKWLLMLRSRNRKHTTSSLQMFFLNTARFVLASLWLLAVAVGAVPPLCIQSRFFFYTGR
jgi:hypothetical protein